MIAAGSMIVAASTGMSPSGISERSVRAPSASQLSGLAPEYSFTDDKDVLGAPEGFTVTIRNVKVSAGAGFIVALTGDIMTMPGLPKKPAADNIDVDADGRISGLF